MSYKINKLTASLMQKHRVYNQEGLYVFPDSKGNMYHYPDIKRSLITCTIVRDRNTIVRLKRNYALLLSGNNAYDLHPRKKYFSSCANNGRVMANMN